LDNKYNFVVKEAFHVGSGDFALLAIYAATKGKFWEMNDLLFNIQVKEGSVKIKELADKVGLDFKELSGSLRSKAIMNTLRIDLWEGFKLGITGTPSYVIDGKVYKGQIPPEIIQEVIQ
jgi:protein-disulfide isomerase